MAALDAGVVALCPDVNADGVKEIIDTDLTDAQINNFINIAYYVSLPLSDALGACGGAAMQCEIIKVLAAHFITLRERQIKSQSVAGEWSVTYLGNADLGLKASLYGQNAIDMDCSGTLAKLGLKKATIEAITYYDLAGTTFQPSDVIP